MEHQSERLSTPKRRITFIVTYKLQIDIVRTRPLFRLMELEPSMSTDRRRRCGCECLSPRR